MPDALALDYETSCELDIRQVGLDRYSDHHSFRPLLCGWTWIGSGRYHLWDRTEDGVRLPAELRDALLDPHVEKWAFNAAFERATTIRGFGIETPVKGWRCTMALAYMHSFTGGLEDVGAQMGIPSSELKLGDEGKRLIRLFCMPQKMTVKNPHVWRTRETNPEDWAKFREYCVRDVEAENAIRRRLIRYPILPAEWELYEIDQIINERGKPVDPAFVENAMLMANKRKDELTLALRKLTGLANPNSQSQFLPWAKARGFQFNDLRKDSIAKSLREHRANEEKGGGYLSKDLVKAMGIREWSNRLSTSKHAAILKRYGKGNRLRGLYQFAGASRTNRWAGRAVQTQNLTRTPKIIEEESRLELATDIIRSGNYDLLDLFAPEPMEIIVGTVRSAFATEPDEEFVVCDLSSIESVVIGYIAGCERILNVFREGRDVYKDFGQVWMRKPYEEITKHERGISKPAVLGAGFRLGGGSLNKEGKRTGLWGYAESMGIDMTRGQSHESVRVFREDYAPEIPIMWRDYEDAVMYVMRTGKPKAVGPITFLMDKPYLVIRLPSGRHMRYYKPMIQKERVYTGEVDAYGEPVLWERTGLTYMGVSQITKRWQRIPTHGGKLTENVVQAFARDILAEGIRRAHRAGFNIVGHVHDEIITLRKRGDERYSLDALREAMTAPISWAPGIPLGGAGWVGKFYKKD